MVEELSLPAKWRSLLEILLSSGHLYLVFRIQITFNSQYTITNSTANEKCLHLQA